MYPIYCISFILNTIWYQDIADEGVLYFIFHGRINFEPGWVEL